jgi:hypothetical protein
MKLGFNSNQTACVTCEYWDGARSLNSTRTQAQYEPNTDGNCLEGGHKVMHKPASAGSGCKKWRKWGQLK